MELEALDSNHWILSIPLIGIRQVSQIVREMISVKKFFKHFCLVIDLRTFGNQQLQLLYTEKSIFWKDELSDTRL